MEANGLLAGSPPPPPVLYSPQGFGSTFLAACFTLSSGSLLYLLPLRLLESTGQRLRSPYPSAH